MRSLALLPVLLAIVTTCCVGCLEVDTTVHLRADGSGTFVEAVTIDLAKVALARRRLKEARTHGERDDLLLHDPFGALERKARLKGLKATEGLEGVTSTEERLPKERLRTILRARFGSIETLYGGGLIDEVEASLTQVPKKNAWRLEALSIYDDDRLRPEERLDPANRKTLLAIRKKLLQSIRPLLAGLRITHTLVFPTKVIDTNGTVAKDGVTVTWTVGFDDLVDPQKLRQWTVFKASPALKLEKFGEPPAPSATKKEDAPSREGSQGGSAERGKGSEAPAGSTKQPAPKKR